MFVIGIWIFGAGFFRKWVGMGDKIPFIIMRVNVDGRIIKKDANRWKNQ